MSLRPYQRDLIARVQHAFAPTSKGGLGHRAVIAQMPTGSGKTHCTAEGVILPSLSQGRRILFLADLEEIILDTVQRLRALDIPAAAILAGRAEDPTAPVQVASEATLISWLKRGTLTELGAFDRIILDECHGAAADTVRALLAALRESGALLLGLTATPARGDGLPLSEFDHLVCGPQPSELVALGALVPCEVFAPPTMLDKGVADDPVHIVLERASDRRCVIFAPTGAEASRIARDLTCKGHTTTAVLDGMHRAERRMVRTRLDAGVIRHVVTVRALQKGFDAPLLDCAILTSPCTIVSWLQSVGRALRACAETGKRDALVFDLRGAVFAHGLPLMDRTWSLAGEQGLSVGPSARPDLRTCDRCHAVFPPATRCIRCGHVHVSDPRPMHIQRAELFAQSGMSDDERVARWIEGAVRTMQKRRPDLSAQWCRAAVMKKPPAWVREALAKQGQTGKGAAA